MDEISEDVDPGVPTRVFGMYCFGCLGSAFTVSHPEASLAPTWRCTDCGHSKICAMTASERDEIVARREVATT